VNFNIPHSALTPQVDAGNEGYLHLRVFKPLPHTGGKPSLSGVQEGKRHGDEIVHF